MLASRCDGFPKTPSGSNTGRDSSVRIVGRPGFLVGSGVTGVLRDNTTASRFRVLNTHFGESFSHPSTLATYSKE